MAGWIPEILKGVSSNALWAVFTKVGGPMIAALLVWIWGNVLGVDGFFAFQATLITLAVVLLVQQVWVQEKARLAANAKPPRIKLDYIEQTVQFLRELKAAPQPIPIKIVASAEKNDQRIARFLADAFEMAGYPIMLREDKTDYLFPARTQHKNLLIRYRPKNNGLGENLREAACIHICNALKEMSGGGDVRYFPTASDIDYLQIDVGGSLE